MVSSYPPRLCGIGTFCEEAREFVQKHNPDRDVIVISHTDGAGDGVVPLIDLTQQNWWKAVADEIHALNPHVVHIEHEYGLYDYRDERGQGDGNEGFLDLLDAISDIPTIVEPHTVHGRLTEFEADFVFKMSRRTDVVLIAELTTIEQLLELSDTDVIEGVRIVEGTPEDTDRIASALQRFEDAGWPLSNLEIRVGGEDGCGGHAGVRSTDKGHDVVDICTDAEFVLLHELGHVWSGPYLDDEHRQEWLELRGLDSWSDADYYDRGTEQAVDIIEGLETIRMIVRVIRFQSSFSSSGRTGWMLSTFSVRSRGPKL